MQPLLLLSGVLLLLCPDKFINKTLQGGKRLLFNSDPWPPAEQKLEMPCDINCVRINRARPVLQIKSLTSGSRTFYHRYKII